MYEIKVLDSEDFDKIAKSDSRYSYVDDSNLGFSDREKGIAYVRDTHIHDLNKYLINHELEELIEARSEHEDPNGIRHKKGPKFFKDILAPFLSGGLIQPEAPQREAAQTQYVEGVGNVPVSQLSSGSYSPFSGTAGSFGEMSGGFGSPLNLFAPSSGSYSASGRLPSSLSGSYQPTITTGIGGSSSELPPDLLEKLRGQYSGRIVF